MITKEQIKANLEKYQRLQKGYKNYPGSPYDDAIYGGFGYYTVGPERAFINKQVKRYKKALEYLEENSLQEISQEYMFIHFF